MNDVEAISRRPRHPSIKNFVVRWGCLCRPHCHRIFTPSFWGNRGDEDWMGTRDTSSHLYAIDATLIKLCILLPRIAQDLHILKIELDNGDAWQILASATSRLRKRSGITHWISTPPTWWACCVSRIWMTYPFVFHVVIPMDTSGSWCCLVVETAKGQTNVCAFSCRRKFWTAQAAFSQLNEHDGDQKIGIALRCDDAILAMKMWLVTSDCPDNVQNEAVCHCVARIRLERQYHDTCWFFISWQD